ncbi:hypothetical protein ACN38_g4512 [Penicillium nordicum]|uniref:Uncharacterized protein n=1 Tax=Penicillium nordicum TaxID=229535 RepID=A0A0M8PAF5_9EURO|nr:hypothetical protein ACN38_g4512 [Penicillium nordicum]
MLQGYSVSGSMPPPDENQCLMSDWDMASLGPKQEPRFLLWSSGKYAVFIPTLNAHSSLLSSFASKIIVCIPAMKGPQYVTPSNQGLWMIFRN